MKTILTSCATFIASATLAAAGNLAYIAPDATMIEEPARMGGSAAWIIPLIVLTGIILAISTTNEEKKECQISACGQ